MFLKMKPENRNRDDLGQAISLLTRILETDLEQRKVELEWFKSHYDLVTKQDLRKAKEQIMSAISDFGARVDAAFEKLGVAVDGVASDVAFLKEEIRKLQENPGPITPEDQAILDGIEARTVALSAKVEALDAATEQPPAPPV
jgi:hypothetical protein